MFGIPLFEPTKPMLKFYNKLKSLVLKKNIACSNGMTTKSKNKVKPRSSLNIQGYDYRYLNIHCILIRTHVHLICDAHSRP